MIYERGPLRRYYLYIFVTKLLQYTIWKKNCRFVMITWHLTVFYDISTRLNYRHKTGFNINLMYRIENSFRLNASINVSVEKTIFKNRPIREVGAIFGKIWHILEKVYTRKRFYRFLNFIINGEGAGFHALSACGFNYFWMFII